MKRILKILLIMMVVYCTPLLVSAQVGSPGDDPDAANAPIDGGLSILLAAGVGYGVKKIYNKKQKVNTD